MSRREPLQHIKVEQAQHAGLWLDKFITSQSREDVGTKQELVAEVARIAVSETYTLFFQRYNQALKESSALIHYGRVKGRMVIGLGAESVLETAVTLHHTYGVPFIPGSALKGLAASYARNNLNDAWAKPATPSKPHALTAYELVFGTTDSAGYVTFFDALYVPPEGNRRISPLAPDVLTVHHREYYGSKGNVTAAPADWDSPVPVPFISATGTYLIALGGDKRWTAKVMSILIMALRDMGIGAKTSSGYGRMSMYSIEPTEQAWPALGEVFSGQIADANAKNVLIEVPEYLPRELHALLPVDATTPQWKIGTGSSFEVVGMRSDKGLITLDVQRAVKAEKKK